MLVVGLNSDRSVQALKGPTRPIVPEGERAEVLAALQSVDLVTLFDEDTPLDLIRTVVPEILVKGGDYREEDIVGRDVVLASGGRVQVIPFVPGASSSAVIDRIQRGKGS
jgi:D-beta-D-heptose 7-phosphate kinase/D-beta-D-heptose 1-phosphate adenosyltransferase